MVWRQSGDSTVLLRVMDTAALVAMLYVSMVIFAVPMQFDYVVAALAAALALQLTGDFTGLYGSSRSHTFADESIRIAATCILIGALLASVAFLTKTSTAFSRLAVLAWGGLAFVAVLGERYLVRYLLTLSYRRGRSLRPAAIVGRGALAQAVAERIQRAPWLGLRIVGFFASSGAATQVEGTGTVEELVSKCHDGEIEHVYIAIPAGDYGEVHALIRLLADTTASVYVAPDPFVSELQQATWTNMDGLPIVSIYETPFNGLDGLVKRIEDLVLGVIILSLAAIPMLMIAVAVKLTSRGPVLFRQRRYGLNGQVVQVLKFRSMTVLEDGEELKQATRGDIRITPLGNFLRKTSLDELPQFFNVLAGNMSIVGPRPHAVSHNEYYRKLIPGYMLRHKIKPGITGLAQIRGWRGETDSLDKMVMRVQCDLEYMRNWSLGLDLKIVLLTVTGGFTAKNAY